MDLNMSMLDLTFIGLLSFGILLFLLGILTLFLSAASKRHLKKMKARRPKNKKKRKQWQRICKKTEQTKKKRMRNGILLIIVSILLGGSAGYARHYQLTSLSSSNAAALAKSYYLIDEIEGQLDSYKNGASIEKTTKNIRDLSQQLAGAGTETAYVGMAVDGQKLVNRHFNLVKNLGINLNAKAREILENQEELTTYLADIDKVKTSQQKVFKEYQVNESALQQKK
ncbi:hypothetical protein I6N96_14585 [Enterococcus sp. BWM-S5]|uniref:DUF4047 domain-containing protein n=1 Tax=Enterococcus larvae TaxID=2794352 RepID=A0ABS4CM56_9ENTE|nr:hypothetical protein [Enterococcus larvae]MBP1047510.1 hypothetical protein [Enterococcus larvae]